MSASTERMDWQGKLIAQPRGHCPSEGAGQAAIECLASWLSKVGSTFINGKPAALI